MEANFWFGREGAKFIHASASVQYTERTSSIQHIPDAPWCFTVAVQAGRILGMRTTLNKEGMEGAKAVVGRTEGEQCYWQRGEWCVVGMRTVLDKEGMEGAEAAVGRPEGEQCYWRLESSARCRPWPSPGKTWVLREVGEASLELASALAPIGLALLHLFGTLLLGLLGCIHSTTTCSHIWPGQRTHRR